MIWIDSSFAIEWLLGSERASAVKLPAAGFATLATQYAEILVFFSKRLKDLTPLAAQLEAVSLKHADRAELSAAAQKYLLARAAGSKASLADAMLAAVAESRDEPVATFDADFAALGCKLLGDGREFLQL